MKFGKSLSNQIEETLPEWRDKFLSYKELKKRLKLIDFNHRPLKRPRSSSEEQNVLMCMTRDEIDFIRFIDSEMDKFNGFFMDKEEEYIIKLKELQDRLVNARESNEELLTVQKEIVDFHGEMVLLENYSALNYTGLVKILKKYEKRTGALIRLPFIQKVLHQPFYTTDVLYKLVKQCELMLDHLFPTTNDAQPCVSNDDAVAANTQDGVLRVPKELEEIEHMEGLYMKSTISALRVLKEIRSKSSTVSVFSLPPLQSNVVDETWNKVPVLEQEAK
ncbi:SPX domain-containing protein 2 [Ranunculus cassubicifolius]